MHPLAAALIVMLTAQRPVPPIDYILPGQSTPAPPVSAIPLSIPADAEIMPFQTGAVTARPSAAARHFLLAQAPAIPTRGMAFTIRCLVDRTNGRTILCQNPTIPAPYRAAALGLGSLYQFRLTPAQGPAPGKPALAVTIADRILPSDVRPAARLFQFTTRPPANVTFAQGLTAEQSQAYYPPGALDAAQTARIRIDCQVQPDLSLFCLNPTGEPGPLLTQFQLAALQLSGYLRAGPTLSNGAAAAGTIFRTTIIFNVPE